MTNASNKANDMNRTGVFDAVNGLQERACTANLDDMVNAAAIGLAEPS